MKNMKRVYRGVLFFALCLAYIFAAQPVSAEISVDLQNEGGNCTKTLEHYTGGNYQNSYLFPVDKGWIIVRFIKKGVVVSTDGRIVVDIFDEDYHMSS